VSSQEIPLISGLQVRTWLTCTKSGITRTYVA